MTVSGTDSVAARDFEGEARRATRSTRQGARMGRMGVEYIEASSGLSAGLWRLPGGIYLGVCGEGVGTKNALIEELVQALNGDPWPLGDPYRYYYGIGQDAVAMIVNDLITLGVLPIGILQIVALFESVWHTNETRKTAFLDGWTNACIKNGVHWSGGETAELNTVQPPHMIADGVCWGLIPAGLEPTLPDSIEPGDEIVFVESSGIHSNGLTGARKMCAELGYDYTLPGGRLLVDALLTPTRIYVDGVEGCLTDGVVVRHSVHLTGGGLSRFLRNSPSVRYVIDKVAKPQPEFSVIQQYKGCTLKQMYEAFNMGQGFALVVGEGHGHRAVDQFALGNQKAWVAGRVEASDRPQVTLVQEDIIWTEAA